MVTKIGRIGAALLCGAFGAALVPGCEIRLGQGSVDSDETLQDPTGGAGEPAIPDTEGLPDEEQAAIEALQNADPEQLRIGTATAVYAAVAAASFVEAQIGDPAMVDEETVEQLFNEYAPIAVEQAILWAQSVDLSTIPAAWNTINFTCEAEPYTCPRKDYCSFGAESVLCVINECGQGSCPLCPWPLNNLVFKSWCVYGCGRGDKYLGAAFRLITRFPLRLGEFTCVPFGRL